MSANTRLVLQINKFHIDKSPSLGNAAVTVLITPPIDEDYWLYRVPVSDKQAIVAFRKFGVIGIGFQHEEDWNTNLPSSCPAEEIYNHIEHNRLDADKNKCIEAIELIRDAIAKTKDFA